MWFLHHIEAHHNIEYMNHNNAIFIWLSRRTNMHKFSHLVSMMHLWQIQSTTMTITSSSLVSSRSMPYSDLNPARILCSIGVKALQRFIFSSTMLHAHQDNKRWPEANLMHTSAGGKISAVVVLLQANNWNRLFGAINWNPLAPLES